MTDKVLDQAIDWLVKLESSQHAPALLAACLAWRQADPRHEVTWQALHEAQTCFSQARALPAGVAISTLAEPGRRAAVKTLALGLLGLGMAGGTLQQTPWRVSLADYSTRSAERRRFELADGTVLKLNSQSALDVRFSQIERRVELREGQVNVKAGPEPLQRPLCVSSAQARFLGSAFDVCQENGRTRLTVDQGTVAIHLPGQPPVPAQAGEQFMVDGAGARRIERPTFEGSAWTRGLLITRQMPLQELAGHLARQRKGWVGCDPAIAALEISGVFQLDDTDNALRTLAHTLPVRLVWRTSLWVRMVPA
ncbi:FecR domain-containing protein [Pseudomonas sp. NPDC089547]|uniref:FecR domain-containing protein n=1 Tax=Pseudomonas sp. NPDC089547 TaxID=3390652 RepID=UPI003CFF0FB3